MLARVKSLAAFTLVMVAAVLGGCNTQRPLFAVLDDGKFNLEHGHYERARDDFAEYIERRPDAVDVRYLYGKSLIETNQARQAIEQLNVAVDLAPLNDTYLDAQAEAMYRANEREALTVLLSRAASERGRVTDYLRLGTYSQKLGNLDEAQQSFLTAAKLDLGQTASVQRALADFYGSIGDKEKQVRRLKMAYYLDSDNQELYKEIRRVGEIPGPSFGIKPEEQGLMPPPPPNPAPKGAGTK